MESLVPAQLEVCYALAIVTIVVHAGCVFFVAPRPASLTAGSPAPTPAPLFDCSRYERLAHLPRGFGRCAVAAHDAWVSLVRLEEAIAQTPNPMHPRDDVPALVALGLTWPEERQRLRHALENVVHAVKGDAGRHLQRLQRYLAHLDAKTLSEEDAAAMFDALQAAPETEADTASSLTPVALRRFAELRSCLDESPAVDVDSLLEPTPAPPSTWLQALSPRARRVAGVASAVTMTLASLCCWRTSARATAATASPQWRWVEPFAVSALTLGCHMIIKTMPRGSQQRRRAQADITIRARDFAACHRRLHVASAAFAVTSHGCAADGAELTDPAHALDAISAAAAELGTLHDRLRFAS